MRLHKTDRRVILPAGSALPLLPKLVMLALLILIAHSQTGATQESYFASSTNHAPLGAAQVVHNLIQMNLQRVQALQAYQRTRTYRAEYHGLGGSRSAEMIVTVKYKSSPPSKQFIVRSAVGSKLILDKVFAKLLEAEKGAMDAEMQRRSALTEGNYRFTMIGYENGNYGPAYVLEVEPRSKDKFLYRGKIWVDATDFAVVRLEAEPAKDPSFWTKKSSVVQLYTKISDFWLPTYNHSVSAIRFGGHAELTIEYENYEITGASQVINATIDGSNCCARTARAQK